MKQSLRSTNGWGLVGCMLVVATFLAASPAAAESEDAAAAQEVVEGARTTVNNFTADPDMGWFRDNVKNAKGVLIVPSLVKALKLGLSLLPVFSPAPPVCAPHSTGLLAVSPPLSIVSWLPSGLVSSGGFPVPLAALVRSVSGPGFWLPPLALCLGFCSGLRGYSVWCSFLSLCLSSYIITLYLIYVQ